MKMVSNLRLSLFVSVLTLILRKHQILSMNSHDRMGTLKVSISIVLTRPRFKRFISFQVYILKIFFFHIYGPRFQMVKLVTFYFGKIAQCVWNPVGDKS